MLKEKDKIERSHTDEHFIEKSGHKSWPLAKIVAILALVLLVFGGGVAVGRGNISLWGHKTLSSKASSELDFTSATAVYDILKRDFDGKLDTTKLDQGLSRGLVEATGDPYTDYFDPAAAKTFNNALSGSITGIGAELGTDDDKNIVIVSPLSGYPAEKAGLKPKDIIAGVNSQSTQGMTVDGVVNKIRGKAGTDVTLTVVRGTDKAFEVKITRQKITVPSVESEIDGNIGYMTVSQFTQDTAGLAQKAANSFKDNNVKGVVLDLRGNPGGYLDASVDLSSLWLDKGKTVVQERRGATVIDTKFSNGNSTLKGLPTVVLIDGGSASASEITAGALHDNSAAQLVGTKSFGKGSVQQVQTLPDGAELKVTIARWFTPAGKNIDKQGIKPDVLVKPGDNDTRGGPDAQKDQATQLVTSKFQQ